METPPSQARAFFDAFLKESDRLAFLRQLVADQREETEWLEFKGCIDRKPKAAGAEIADADVKRIFSEAMCGFANTAGGVLVWGIDCAKDSVGIDCAKGFSLAKAPKKLKGRLRELSVSTGDPPLAGIEVEAVEDGDANGEGFVVCFAPESRFRPHRAEHAGRRFVMRANDSFFDMPVSHLRQLFHPVSSPMLFTRLKMFGTQLQPTPWLFQLVIELGNKGTRTAEQIFFRVSWTPFHKNRSLTLSESWESNFYGNWIFLHHKTRMHPGQSDILVIFRQPLERSDPFGPLTVTIDVFASDMQPSRSVVIYPADEVGKTVTKYPIADPLPPEEIW